VKGMLGAAVMTACLAIAATSASSQSALTLGRTSQLEANIAPGQVDRYSLPLGRGESADLVVLQQGVDLAVDVIAPDGRLITTVDSPNGREGPEPVTIQAAAAGRYAIQVRPLASNEPAGRYRLTVTRLRNAAASRRWLLERREVRQQAVDWLRARSVAIPPIRDIGLQTPMTPFDELAGRVRVLGLGEATHGSREFADLRLALTKRLVERHGYRVIALEQSAARIRSLLPYVNGQAALTPAVSQLLERGWMGRRSLAELVEWSRRWNIAHSRDPIRLVGVDAQDYTAALDSFGEFLAKAYGGEVTARWISARTELLAADAQSSVFGNSDVSAATRAFVVEIYGMLEHDQPLLRRRFDPAEVDHATEAARDLAQFADYNGNGSGAVSHNRDWYMAVNILRALGRAGADARAVYWAHNAHVATTSARYQPTGTVLRSALGCGYAAVGTTFGAGTFIAQVPDDPENDILEFTLPPADEDTIDSAMAELGRGAAFATWPCRIGTSGVPAWLAQPRPMRWVGGLFTPGGAPSTATRAFTLTTDFDAVFYVPTVTAEAIPTDRRLIPARPR